MEPIVCLCVPGSSYCVQHGARIFLDNRAEDYRRLASECLRLVATMSTEEGRRGLIEMARVWTRLADGAVTPVVQQQQQIQPKKGDGK
jgi:hypothetical protein